MAIIQTVDFSDFCDAFRELDRQDQYSYEAKKAIFDYLEEYSDSTGEPVEFDVIAICCEWSEMTWKEAAEYYSIDLSHIEDDNLEELQDAVYDHLCDNTVCLDLNNGSFVFVNF